MAYLLFLLANAALFVRPAELMPALGNAPIYLALIGSSILCNLPGLQNQLRTRTLLQQPANLCLLGVVAAVPVSHVLSDMNLSAAYHGFVGMAKIAAYYLMLVSVVNTPQRLRQLMQVTAICSTILVAVSIRDFQNFTAAWSGAAPDLIFEVMDEDNHRSPDQKILRHVVETHGADLAGNTQFVFRMRGLGIFNDPNDVALLIAITAVICVYFLTDKQLPGVRFLWLLPLAILGYGYLQTQSRGGLLAIGAAGVVWLAVRYGGKVAIGLGLLGLLAAPLALGRAGNIDVSDGSGQARVLIWGEGLAEIKNPHILFGVGEGNFEQLVGHVAHNSYIHAYVELGFIGGTLFFGCFFLPGYAIYRLQQRGCPVLVSELRRMMPYIAAILAAWAVGMASLSRCYAPSTFMIVGLCAAFVNLAGFHQTRPRPVVAIERITVRNWAVCSAGLLMASFVFVRIFARFGA